MADRRPVPRVSCGRKPPVAWRSDLSEVLITPTQIARRVAALANEVQQDLGKQELVVVALLNGTVLFLADLIRHLSTPLRLDFIGVSSYGSSKTPGELTFTKELRLDVRGRQVLLIDDILDTGRTLAEVRRRLLKLGPASLRLCVFLNKPARQRSRIEADYVGFHIPDRFVVGYGMDYAERYRNLPFVGVLKTAAAPSPSLHPRGRARRTR